ncbi:MAG: hypothetical protein HQ565_08235 [Bacteroidetes bacterium]|nr:hypothetical protein [Bacteroidota bacterium]
MPVGTALWTIEASSNYDFASEKDSVPDLEYDSLIVEIDSYYDDGELMLEGESIMEAYDDIIDFINQELNAAPNTVLIAADLNVINAGAPLVSFELSTITGPIVTGNMGINSTDYWWAVVEAGKCDQFQGEEEGKDAADRISQVLNWNYGMAYACVNGGVLFYTSINIEENIFMDDFGWYLFWYGLNGSTECLEPSEMSYWVGEAEGVIESNRPSGKVFIDVEFIDDLDMNFDTFFHKIKNVSYGIINCAPPNG